MKTISIALILFSANTQAERPSAVFRVTAQNAKDISLMASCVPSGDGYFYAAVRSEIRFSQNQEELSRTYVSTSAGRSEGVHWFRSCDQARNAATNSSAYPSGLLTLFSEIKEGDLIIQEIGQRIFCFLQYIDLFISANDPLIIADWRTGRTAVACRL